MERKFSPRFWLGCDFFAWMRILARGRFELTLPHVHIGVIAAMAGFGHTLLKYAQNARYRREIEQTEIKHPPIFIVGHWRTGTTLLHELMILDPKHSFLNTYQCLDPNHFLITEELFKKWFTFLLPERRPMDNMKVDWESPQEDEFAMCMLGQPSPYLDIIFPNRASLTPGALDLEGLGARQRESWKRAYRKLLQTKTCRDPRRLILKSPPHSCRIPTLLELFPEAHFVHIMRNPYNVFPSTVKLWKCLADKQSVQTPHHRNVEEKVLSTFPQLYGRLHEGKKLVAPSRFHEMYYEDLVQDPIGEMRNLYSHFDFDGFDQLQPRIANYFAQNANFETNRFNVTPEQRSEINRRWGSIIEHYNYPLEPVGALALPRPVTMHETEKSAPARRRLLRTA